MEEAKLDRGAGAGAGAGGGAGGVLPPLVLSAVTTPQKNAIP